MANLKQDLDEYLLLQSDQKKSFKIEMPIIKVPDKIGNLFKKNEPDNSWLKDSEESCCPKLTRLQRILGFIVFMGLGIFLLISSTFYIPFLILKARKFAMLYTLGSFFIIISFGFISGFTSLLMQLFSRPRLFTSLSYTASLMATLYFAIIMQSTFLTVCFAVIQIISLIFMIMSSVPGGTSGMKFFGSLFKSSVANTLPV